MRIGFLLPSQFAVGNPGNGILEQARNLALAMEQRGHEVIRLNPWEHCPKANLDVLHFFLGGAQLYGIERGRKEANRPCLVFSPIIDSNYSNTLYRFAARCGEVHPRVFTIQGLLRQQALASDVVVCRSRHERHRIMEGLGIPESKVAVVLNGIDVQAVPSSVMADVKLNFSLPDKFVLHISSYTQERKNTLRLVDAVDKLGIPLVIAGHSEPGAVHTKLSQKAQHSKNIRMLGFIDKQTRNALYALCHVFCLPSHHEGTGLAALEAGLLGAHLVITKNGGPPDYFGPHAVYVNPFELEDISHALQQVWNQPRHDALRDHIAKNLTWHRSAEKLEAVYSEHLAL